MWLVNQEPAPVLASGSLYDNRTEEASVQVTPSACPVSHSAPHPHPAAEDLKGQGRVQSWAPPSLGPPLARTAGAQRSLLSFKPQAHSGTSRVEETQGPA